MKEQNSNTGCVGCLSSLICIGIIIAVAKIAISFFITIIIVFFILLGLAIIQKPNTKDRDISEEKNNLQTSGITVEELRIKETEQASKLLKHVKELAYTINTTINEDVFEKSLEEIKRELEELCKYEESGIFVSSYPSSDLKRIIENEYLTRKRFNERLQENEDFLEEKYGEKERETNESVLIDEVEKLRKEIYELREESKKSKEDSRKQKSEIKHPRNSLIKPKEEAVKKKNNGRYLSEYELERYAIMCNTALEHDEEMEKYKDFF